jgi:hypothetical protein
MISAQPTLHHCDSRPNTLTLIRDTQENVFGGFTPVKWESRIHNNQWGDDEDKCFNDDDSLRSFVFTLKNPNSVRGRKTKALRL